MPEDAWHALSARSGGTVSALAWAAGPGGSPIVFAGTTAGLHCSADAGRTWRPAAAGPPLPFVEALAPSVEFARDRTIFAGTRQGAHRSTDGGATWQPVLVGSRVLALACAGDVVFVGTETDGILRSQDGGRDWSGVNAGLLDLAVLALALSPRFESDATAFAATASGLYRSRNGGRAWRAVDLPLDDPAVQCLAISPRFADDRLVLAGTEEDGLLRSNDGGTTWEVVPALEGQGVTAVAFSGDGATVAAATAEGVAVSRDGGVTWRAAALGPALSLTFVPSGAGDVLLAGLVGRGVMRSDDGGATWTPASEGPRAHLLSALAISPGFADDRTLFAAGLEDGVVVSTDGGVTWEKRDSSLDDLTVMGLALSPSYPRDRVLFAATAAGLYRSLDGAGSWEPALLGVTPATLGALVTTPAGAEGSYRVLAAALGKRIVASDDAGATWTELGTGLEGEVIALAASPDYGRDRALFAATTQRVEDYEAGALALWRSTDGGRRWERWLDAQGSSVLPICVSPEYPADGAVFVGLAGRVLRPMRGAQEVVRGARRPIWQSADVGGPTDAVTAIAASPAFRDDRTLFAATSAGIWRSRDGGERFDAWSEGLTPPSILGLAVSPDYARDGLVFAIGVDGTIWRRQDPR